MEQQVNMQSTESTVSKPYFGEQAKQPGPLKRFWLWLVGLFAPHPVDGKKPGKSGKSPKPAKMRSKVPTGGGGGSAGGGGGGDGFVPMGGYGDEPEMVGEIFYDNRDVWGYMPRWGQTGVYIRPRLPSIPLPHPAYLEHQYTRAVDVDMKRATRSMEQDRARQAKSAERTRARERLAQMRGRAGEVAKQVASSRPPRPGSALNGSSTISRPNPAHDSRKRKAQEEYARSKSVKVAEHKRRLSNGRQTTVRKHERKRRGR